MDSVTGFDEEESFFGSYEADRASVCTSLAWQDFGETQAQPPTPEQLTHLNRFRRPVAAVVAAMALFSLVALGKYGTRQHGPRGELVAHYGSAIAAPTPRAIGSASVEQTAVMSDTSSVLLAEAWSSFVAEALSVFVPEASAASAAQPSLAVSGTEPALAPAVHDPALAALSTQADRGTVSAFISALKSVCLRPAESDVTLDRRPVQCRE